MSLAEQLFLGVYLGVVTGLLPGVVAWALAFVFKYFTDVTLPALGVMVLAVALAGVPVSALGVTVVAVDSDDGLHALPTYDRVLKPGDVVHALGRPDELRRLTDRDMGRST
ncbi:MAG: hypothetical protein ACLFMT_04090 [Halobacteriales archaeon]